MDAYHVEGVVIAQAVLEQDATVADHAAGKADDQSRHDSHETGCGRNGDEARQRTGDGTQGRGLAEAQVFKEHPAEDAAGRGQMGGDQGVTRKGVGSQSTAGIEAEPAEPEQAAAKERHGQIIGDHGRLAEISAGTYRMGAGQGRGGGSHMHYGAQLGHPATAPDPVCHGAIGKDRPECGKDQHGRETDAFGIGTGDERHGKGCEHALEGHEDIMRQIGCGAVGFAPHAHEEHMVKVADKAGDIAAEGKGIAEQGPDDGNHPQGGIAVHACGEDVL